MNSLDSSTSSLRGNNTDGIGKDQLVADFNVVLADAEALLKATANQGSEKIDELRARTKESLKAMTASLASAQDALMAKTREAATATDVYVHKNPWAAIGVASGVSLLIGLLLRRR